MAMSQDRSKYQSGEPPTAASLEREAVVSPDALRDHRLPPGQVRTRKWPILHWKSAPEVSREQWRLFIQGLAARPTTLTWDEYQSLPRVRVFADFHCVTRWSRLGNVWEGVPTRALMEYVGVDREARCVVAHGADDGYTTNVPMEWFAAEDSLLCDRHDGEPLSVDHGGPVRLIVPRLYAWKSAKWLCGLEFLATESLGYWERNGYHAQGDPWKEQRYSW